MGREGRAYTGCLEWGKGDAQAQQLGGQLLPEFWLSRGRSIKGIWWEASWAGEGKLGQAKSWGWGYLPNFAGIPQNDCLWG